MLNTLDKIGLAIISLSLLLAAYLIIIWGNMIYPNMWSTTKDGVMGVLVVFLTTSLVLSGVILVKNVYENNQIINISLKDMFKNF